MRRSRFFWYASNQRTDGGPERFDANDRHHAEGRRESIAPMHNIAVCNVAAIGWREEMIRRIASMRSQRRATLAGKELEDWLAAEQEVDQLIACGGAPYA
jgi:hypothetical protein